MIKSRKEKERMAQIVARLQKYVESYDQQSYYDEYEDRTFIDDIIYGIGIAIEPEEYRWAQGYQKFKQYLKDEGII